MTKIFTKTREGAKVVSREADFLEYRQTANDPVVGATNDIGSISTDQTSKGVWYPTVQAAIQDLRSLLTGGPGDVAVNTTGVQPGGVSQIGQVTITGTVSIIDPEADDPTNPVGAKRIIEIMGIPVTVVQGETGDQVALKFSDAAKALALQNKVFSQADQQSAEPTTVEFVHIDYRVHTYEDDIKKYGLNISYSMTSPQKNGIGTWILLGQEAKTFEGATDVVTLYYYKRLA